MLVVAIGIPLGSFAYANWGGGYCPRFGDDRSVESFRSFQKDTLPLQDEIVAKRLEIRNEYAKENPDRSIIAKLEKDIIDIRTKIEELAEEKGFSDRGPGWMMRGGGYGRGFQGGYGGGFCSRW